MVSDLNNPNQNMDTNSADQFLEKNRPFHTNTENDLRQNGIPLEDADAWLAPDQSRAASSEPLFSLDTGELERVLVTSPEDAPLSDIPTWAGGGAPWDVSELRNQDLNQPSAADDSTPQVPERRSIFADDPAPAITQTAPNTNELVTNSEFTKEVKETDFKINNPLSAARPPMPNVPVFSSSIVAASADTSTSYSSAQSTSISTVSTHCTQSNSHTVLTENKALDSESACNNFVVKPRTTRPPMPTPPALIPLKPSCAAFSISSSTSAETTTSASTSLGSTPDSELPDCELSSYEPLPSSNAVVEDHLDVDSPENNQMPSILPANSGDIEDEDDIPLGLNTAALSSPQSSSNEPSTCVNIQNAVTNEVPAPAKNTAANESPNPAKNTADTVSTPAEMDSLATKTMEPVASNEEPETSKLSKTDLESPASATPDVNPSTADKSSFTSDWGNSPENADDLFETNYQPRSRVAAHLWSLVFSILLIPFIVCLFGSAANLLNSKLLSTADFSPLNVGLILGAGFIILLLQAIITTRSTLGTFLVGLGLIALYVSHNLTTVIANALTQVTNIITDTVGIDLGSTVQSGLNYCGLLGVFIVIMALCSHVSRRAGQRDYHSKTAIK